MLWILLLIIVCTAIIGFFAQEFTRLFKRIAKIPGASVVLPLLIASFIIEIDLLWGTWILLKTRWLFFYIEQHCHQHLPLFYGAASIYRILFLTLVGLIPLWIYWFNNRKKRIPGSTKWAFRLSVGLWVLVAILMVTGIHSI